MRVTATAIFGVLRLQIRKPNDTLTRQLFDYVLFVNDTVHHLYGKVLSNLQVHTVYTNLLSLEKHLYICE